MRPIGAVEGPGVPETVARMEVALKAGDLAKAIAEFDTLPEPAKAAGAAFADKIRARLEVEKLVDQAIAAAMKAREDRPMIRILFFLVVVFALGLGFAWLADRPGDMVVTFSGYQYQVSLMVAAVAVTAVVAAVMIAWWLVKSIWNSPYTIARYFRVRQRDRGYQALSTGMIAAGAGDAALARKMNKQAAKLIRSDTEPLIHLLDAQASLLEGDHEAAREKFERMLDDPEMRLLGLRGLYLEAERLGDRAAARHYAGRAADVAPQLAWASELDAGGKDRARRLGRRAEAGRRAEIDAPDRARRRQPPPRRAADRQGAGRCSTPTRRPPRPRRSRPTGCGRISRRRR